LLAVPLGAAAGVWRFLPIISSVALAIGRDGLLGLQEGARRAAQDAATMLERPQQLLEGSDAEFIFLHIGNH
jgi:hypothetical protein